jgi:3-hydroxyacyl-CoA dehydrogenase
MKDKKIGFIGLGNVGSKIAYNILKNKNYSLYIFDSNKKTSKKLVSECAILCNSIEELINKGFDKDLVRETLNKITINEYKRRQAPIGIRVSNKAFGIGRRYPIINHFREEVS